MSELPSWVLDLYNEPIEKASRASLKRLVSEMANLLVKHDFDIIDVILKEMDCSRLPPEIIMGIPRSTACAKPNLFEWDDVVRRANRELLERGLPAKEIMVGLIDLSQNM